MCIGHEDFTAFGGKCRHWSFLLTHAMLCESCRNIDIDIFVNCSVGLKPGGSSKVKVKSSQQAMQALRGPGELSLLVFVTTAL